MSELWLIPLVVALLGITAVVALFRVTVGSAKDLGEELLRFGELHVALARLRTEAHVTARILDDRRDR